jgi:putative DNA primase/helicase
MIKKLTTPEELSGFLNHSLDGLTRLLERGDFSYAPTPGEVSEMYIKASDPVYAFVTDKCKLGPDYWISTDDLYRAFLEYCAEENIAKPTKESFGRAIKGGRLSVGIHSSRRRVNGEQTTGLAGITLRSNEKEE